MKEIMPDYQLNREGGRIKSAGVPVDFVFEKGELFKDNPSVETAAEVTNNFSEQRKKPLDIIVNRFFPQEKSLIRGLIKGTPVLYRPVLKTDQGPGKFLGFSSNDKEGEVNSPFRVSIEQGYVMIEAFFKDQLNKDGDCDEIKNELASVREGFASGDFYEARLALERLQMASKDRGLVYERRADVGRTGLMFIHPAKAEEPIVLPKNLAAKAEDKVNLSVGELIDRAERQKKAFCNEHSLPFRPINDVSLPAYFQADVQLLANGDVMVAELQIPDVGLFLCGLNPHGNEVLSQIQTVVKPLRNSVINVLNNRIKQVYETKGERLVFLVTRSRVVGNREDVLEIKELVEIQRELAERGISSQVVSASQASEIEDDSLMFIFNLDPNSDEFKKLATAYLRDTQRRLIMVPDPFLRVVEKEVTNYSQVQISEEQMANLNALVGSTETQPEKIYSQMMAVDYFLRQIGVEEEVLHFCHPRLPTPIPAYRYDVRSLHIANKSIRKKDIKGISLRSIPISPERGVLQDKDGGVLYATFRFMFTK